MKKNLLWLAGALMASMAFTSCYYDPYYGGGSTTVGGSYSSGYGDGYGYGGSSFNTSVFVSTGNPRWGYDPYCYSYYDYSSRRYYDPYLNGYYPIGYRPPIVYGVPHPYGYRRGYCPPPSHIHGGYVSNYRNREYAYRNSSYGWAKQVRQQSAGSGRQHGSRPAQSQYDRQQQGQGRPNNASRSNNAYSRDSQMRNPQRESSRPSTRQNNTRQSARNNTLVNSYEGQRASRQGAGNPQRQQAQRQQSQRNAGNQQRQQGQRHAQQGGGGGGGQRQGQGQGEKEGKRQQGYR